MNELLQKVEPSSNSRRTLLISFFKFHSFLDRLTPYPGVGSGIIVAVGISFENRENICFKKVTKN